jgi:hypothetical protein
MDFRIFLIWLDVRYFILTILTIIVAAYIFLVGAVEDDQRWFQEFSNNQGEDHFDIKLVNKIAQLEAIEPPPPLISFTPVFVKSHIDSIAVTSFRNLHKIYLKDYDSQYQEFPDFLFEILNGRIKLNIARPLHRLYCHFFFKIDSTIDSLYTKNGISGLLNQHLRPKDSTYVLADPNLSFSEDYTISYFLFLHQLVRERDDYRANVCFQKLKLPQ